MSRAFTLRQRKGEDDYRCRNKGEKVITGGKKEGRKREGKENFPEL